MYSFALTLIVFFVLSSLLYGDPAVFLPLFHYAIMDYSTHLASRLIEKYTFLGQSDAHFVTEMYKMLRDLFSYRPVLTSAQFLSTGFGEHKMNFLVDVCRFVKSEHAGIMAYERESDRQTDRMH